jgi:hypothetical protein
LIALIHCSIFARDRVRRHERRSAADLVDVAHDRAGLEQHQLALAHRRDAAPWMTAWGTDFSIQAMRAVRTYVLSGMPNRTIWSIGAPRVVHHEVE